MKFYNFFSRTQRRLAQQQRRIAKLQQYNDHQIVISYPKNKKSIFAELCDHYNTDKGTNSYRRAHSYSDFYEMLFWQKRDAAKNVMECGIGTGVSGTPGASLRVWRDYFPNAQIVGLDIDSNLLVTEDRIESHQVDQTNADSIARLYVPIKDRKFDIIIEDGLHTFEAGICFFENIVVRLAENGVYIIEDIAQSDLQSYSDFFEMHTEKYNVRLINLHRPNKNINDNSLVMITRK